ncbi:MAG: AMIN domain-containing protein [Armatimonadetes bacterium]|nr:AMIN domain-containing protein [Armatimonadota bacterium]
MRVLRMVVALLLVAGLAAAAKAAPIRDINVTEGPGWVRVNVATDGPVNHQIKHLPPGSEDYRSIVVDVWPAHIPGNMEPKSRLPVNQGLVAQVRVSQHTGNTVRIWIDVIAWPKYTVRTGSNGITIGLDAFHMRDEAAKR